MFETGSALAVFVVTLLLIMVRPKGVTVRVLDKARPILGKIGISA